MIQTRKNELGFSMIEALVVIVVIALVALGSWYVYKNHHKSPTPPAKSTQTATTSNAPKSTTPANPYTGWKTYTSSVEKATFKYPANWTQDTQDQYVSNDPTNTDFIALKSPDGKVIVRWTSVLDGFGNEHGDTYPLNTVISKTAVSGASGDYVVSGITTLDGTSFYPWIAVENDPAYGVLTSGVGGNLDLFLGRNNVNATTGKPDTALFSTSGPHTSVGATSLTKSEAEAYLTSTDMQQARLILQSLLY